MEGKYRWVGCMMGKKYPVSMDSNIKSIKMEGINLVSMTDFTTTKKSEVEVKVLYS